MNRNFRVGAIFALLMIVGMAAAVFAAGRSQPVQPTAVSAGVKTSTETGV